MVEITVHDLEGRKIGMVEVPMTLPLLISYGGHIFMFADNSYFQQSPYKVEKFIC